ncbi:hypothetical protein E5673_01230 [Sphingomonas sp. PAMC26645]|uniref:hypothetical protein n=1 Tax=Sphingomonas sp. PAMC26645 TaxID=2565555 RepID=UPI00109DA9AA|nr:hypothetical protein [Sphingomonas sp. PAMC26645]QCB41018.1 hypothetical protein E5673_01230 [Sphingomonas sp. PAMC26645]
MLSLVTRAAVETAIRNPSLDPDLRNLLAIRASQLADDTEPDIELGDLAHFHAVEAGDGMIEVKAALGFAVDINLVDGVAFGHSDFVPSWEWIEHHVGYFELAFVLSDDGFGHILLVPDQLGVDPRLLDLCKSYAS